MQVLVQLAEKSDKRAARFDRSKIGFHPNVAEAKASAIAMCSRNASRRSAGRGGRVRRGGRPTRDHEEEHCPPSWRALPSYIITHHLAH